jgi:hypothetical protein
LGNEVELTEPAELKEAIRTRLKELLVRYGYGGAEGKAGFSCAAGD